MNPSHLTALSGFAMAALMLAPVLLGDDQAILQVMSSWRDPDNDKGITLCTEAIELNPNDSFAHKYRGMAFAGKKDYMKAIADFSEAIRLGPNDAVAYVFRGDSYNARGDYDKAVADYTEAIRLDFKDVNIYDRLRESYFSKGDYAGAIASLKDAIRMEPTDSSRYQSLASILATCPKADIRDGKAAVEYAKKACELTHGRSAADEETLAAAYAEAGDFEQAIHWQKEGIVTRQICKSDATEARQCLKLYEAHKPYHAGK